MLTPRGQGLISRSPFSWHPPINRNSLPQWTSQCCISPRISNPQGTLSVSKLTIMWCRMATMALKGLIVIGHSVLTSSYVSNMLLDSNVCLGGVRCWVGNGAGVGAFVARVSVFLEAPPPLPPAPFTTQHPNPPKQTLLFSGTLTSCWHIARCQNWINPFSVMVAIWLHIWVSFGTERVHWWFYILGEMQQWEVHWSTSFFWLVDVGWMGCEVTKNVVHGAFQHSYNVTESGY